MKKILTLFLGVILATIRVQGQYCTPIFANPCTSDLINDFYTTGGVSNITNNNSGCNGNLNNYIFYSGLSCSQIQGQDITLNMKSGSMSQIFRVWIDWNQDNDFADAGEAVYVSISGTSLFTANITVPLTAVVGNTRMRVLSSFNIPPSVTDFCGAIQAGEAEDYVFKVITNSPCTGTPIAGSATTTASPVCPGVNYTLNLTGNTSVAGLTYQWQSSSDNITFTDILSATSQSFNTSQSTSTYYRCVVTCTSSGLSDISSSIFVNSDSFVNCFCASNATSKLNEDIINVSLNTMSNNSTCSTTGGPGSVINQYSDYTKVVQPEKIALGASYDFSIKLGSCGTTSGNMTKIFIDYNRNGLFTDAGETVYTTPVAIPGGHTESGVILVPLSASLGITRMRVVNVRTTTATAITPCGTYLYGETEDYLVNIVPTSTCPQPTNLSLVSSTQSSAVVSWTPGGSETQWQVQYGLEGFAIGTGTILNVSNTPSATISNGLINRSLYQVFVRAICGPGDTSDWVGIVNFNTYGQKQYFEANAECMNFIDISSTGKLYSLLTDDKVGISLSFPFLYQGTVYNDATLGNDGVLVLGTTQGVISNTNGVITAAPTGLYPYWDNFQSSGNGVWTQTIGTAPNRKFVIQWKKDNNDLNANNTMNFEVIIDEATTEIYYVYDDVDGGNLNFAKGLSASIGAAGDVQDIQLSFNNTAYLTQNSCAHFYYTDCAKPTNFLLTYVKEEEAAFSWTAGLAAESNWTIIYGPAGFDPMTSGITITSNSPNTILPNLVQNTRYDVYIFADCSPILQSNGLFATFLTAPFCANPGGVVASSDVDSLGLSWTWTATNPAPFNATTGFNIQYGPIGFPLYSGTTVAVDNNLTDTIVDVSLLAGGVYQVYVQAVCGSDTSAFVGPVRITMPLSNDSVCGAEMLMTNGTVYTFNNTGATVAVGESTIAPPVTGLQTNNGWSNSVLNNTTWFKFIAPTSGRVRVNCKAINYTGQAAVYSVSTCNSYSSFALLAANDNAIEGGSNAPNFTVCGMVPGNTYYLLHDGNSATTADYSISISAIDLEAGTFVDVLDVCSGDLVDLFDGITGNQAGGVWSSEIAVVGAGLNGSQLSTSGLGYQVFDFEYRVTDGCAYDSIIAQVKIYGPTFSGNDGSVTVCRNEPFNLLSGLSGNFDSNGTWYDPSSNSVSNPMIVANNIAGQYNYEYVTMNGVCPNDTSNVLVNVSSTCDYLLIEELMFEQVNVYPNPSTGMVYIDNTSDLNFEFEVLDLNGRIIDSNTTNIVSSKVVEINLSENEKGMYMLRIFNSDAQKTYRIVIQ